MYVCMYYQKNDEGKSLMHYEVFEQLETMMTVLEQMADTVIGPILTFEAPSAFIYYRK